jgi:hypothetical protein
MAGTTKSQLRLSRMVACIIRVGRSQVTRIANIPLNAPIGMAGKSVPGGKRLGVLATVGVEWRFQIRILVAVDGSILGLNQEE